jgi:hypothetical protein
MVAILLKLIYWISSEAWLYLFYVGGISRQDTSGICISRLIPSLKRDHRSHAGGIVESQPLATARRTLSSASVG